LKLYQYLASGVPVVATPIPAVEEVGDAATVATNAAEFADAIEDGIASRRRPAACATRRSAARRFDWQEVADRQLAIARAKLEARA
jgi:glycosyltransferase involved in cell wall biosynthesis